MNFRMIPTYSRNIIIINVLVYLISEMTSIASLDINRLFGLYYFGVADFKWYQLLTNFFLHANLFMCVPALFVQLLLRFILVAIVGRTFFATLYQAT